jgi:phosphatidate cytidylyltransferase
MAFNRQTFRTRTLTAIIFAAIMVTGILWNPWSFLILFSIIHFGCWWEYLKLTEKINNTSFHAYTKLGLMVMGYGLMLWFCGSAYHINNYGLKENLSLPVSAAGFALLLVGIFQKNTIHLKAFAMALAGLVYISLCWGLMMDLGGIIREILSTHLKEMTITFRSFDYFPVIIPCSIVFSIWINDTMAYIAGSLFGKTPLSKISPKKTWEGTLAGIILCVAATGILFSNIPSDITVSGFHFSFSDKTWYIIAAITAIAGVSGDLLESKLKRLAGVKDSGTLMPGHGGFLDRFDSLLLATPFVWLYVQLLIK